MNQVIFYENIRPFYHCFLYLMKIISITHNGDFLLKYLLMEKNDDVFISKLRVVLKENPLAGSAETKI